MKNIFRIFSLFALLAVAVSCDEKPEPEIKKAETEVGVAIDRTEFYSLTFTARIKNADKAAYLVAKAAEEAPAVAQILSEGVALEFDTEASYTAEQSVQVTVGELESEESYRVYVAAENADWQKEASSEIATIPEPAEEQPDNSVQMSEIEFVSIVAHAVELSVTTRYMDDFGFVVVPTAEYKEMTAEEVIASSATYYWADGNLSWEQEFTFPFNHDTNANTDYTVVAAAVNATSEIVRTATFTTPQAEMTVEKISFKPTSVRVTHSGTDHYLIMSTALKELCVHLVSDGFGGRYDNNDEDASRDFVAEGTYFKELNVDDSWTVYDDIDLFIGNVDLYENVVLGKWEIFGSFCFAIPNTDNGWLTIEIEIQNGVVVEGAERTEPVEIVLKAVEAEAVQSEDDKRTWSLTLTQDDDNTITFDLSLDSSKYTYIPSGEYYYDGLGAPCLNGASMIVTNVRTTMGQQSVGESKLVVEYDATTQESYFSGVVYVASGTAVVNIERCGPFNLYEEEVQDLAVFEESRNLMIWAAWESSTQTWVLNFMGDNFYGDLYFTTNADSSSHLPEGRYTFSKSAPADGGLWLDCSRSYVAKLRTSEKNFFLCDVDDAYFDVTTTVENGNYMHTIKGVIRTDNGFYQINFDYGLERGSIY